MPPVSKTTAVSFVLYVVGIICHIRGRNFGSDQQAAWSQLLGVIFDAVASILLYLQNNHLIHVEWFTAIEQNQKVTQSLITGVPPNAPASQAPTGLTGGNLVKLALFGLLLAPLMTVSSGCVAGTPLGDLLNPQSTDQQRIDGAQRSYLTIAQVLVILREDHKINDRTWAIVVKASNVFNDAMDKVQADVAAGKKLDQSTFWDVAQQSLFDLTAQKELINGGSTTRPATGAGNP